jgi:hypothetical protein
VDAGLEQRAQGGDARGARGPEPLREHGAVLPDVIAGGDCGFATFAGSIEIHPSIVWTKLPPSPRARAPPPLGGA